MLEMLLSFVVIGALGAGVAALIVWAFGSDDDDSTPPSGGATATPLIVAAAM